MTGHVAGVRIGYAEAPAAVHDWVAARLGGPVVGAVDCVGGMSPGPATRLRAADGATAFLKACGPGLNPDTPGLIRGEARILAALPEHPSLPALVAAADDLGPGAPGWAALLVEDVPGRLAPLPWRDGDLCRVIEAVRGLRPVLRAADVPSLPAVHQASRMITTHWREMGRRLDAVDPWWARHYDVLAGHAARAAEAVAGDAVVHWDLRADNVLLGPERTVLIDWAQAHTGAPWLDLAMVALDTVLSGGDTPFAEVVTWLPEVPPTGLLALTCAFALACRSRALDPVAPGLPTLRATQARWAENLRGVLTGLL